jgi:hypothetical protein
MIICFCLPCVAMLLLLCAVSFSRQQAGIQDLTIEFPLTPYRGMGREAGYNAIYFWSVVHCWVKNVAIINADMAVTLDGTHFCTVRMHTSLWGFCRAFGGISAVVLESDTV